MIVPIDQRRRFRDVVPNAYLGTYATGPDNGITDVPGVLVHTTTLREGNGAINTGVTTILPRKEWSEKACTAGIFRLNGAGEMTGAHWIEETGLLHSPVVITNTYSVGIAYTGIYKYGIAEGGGDEAKGFFLPLVAETFDGHLNDLTKFAVTPEHVMEGITNASTSPLQEGNAGGGTGMMCHGFKGGNGTSSRIVTGPEGKQYTIGVAVQANYGRMQHLHMCGVPIGRILAAEAARDSVLAKRKAAYDAAKDKKDGSIIIVIATDAPLHPTQLRRLARRATVGLSRVGGHGHNQSGDIFLAFSTASEIPVPSLDGGQTLNPSKPRELDITMTDDYTIDGLFDAVADATEEAIYNVLCKAETMTGQRGHTVHALPLDRLAQIMSKYLDVEKALIE